MYIITIEGLMTKTEIAVGVAGDGMNASVIEKVIGKRLSKVLNDAIQQVTVDSLKELGVGVVAETYRHESNCGQAEVKHG